MRTRKHKPHIAHILTVSLVWLILSANAAASDWFVRPTGGSYGSEDGSSYQNAWDGLLNVVWGAGGVEPGDTLYVCGLHVHDMTNRGTWYDAQTQADITPVSGTSESARVTIRGDYSNDPGIVWGAYGMSYDTWTNEGNGVWSIWLAQESYGDWYFQDIGNPTNEDFVVLDKETSVANVANNPGSHYSSNYDSGTLLYVKLTDSGNPTGRIYANRWGYDWKIQGLQYITFLNLKFYNPYNFLWYAKIANHIRWEGCTLAYGEHSLIGIWSDYMEVINCDLSWASNGIYTMLNNPSHYVFKGNYIHDIGVREINWNTDAHAIGIMGGHDGLIENNYMVNVGNAVLLHTFHNQELKNTIIRYNYVKDTHTFNVAGYGITLQTENAAMSDRTGIEIYGNIVKNAKVAYRTTFTRDLIKLYNNLAINSRSTSFYFGGGTPVIDFDSGTTRFAAEDWITQDNGATAKAKDVSHQTGSSPNIEGSLGLRYVSGTFVDNQPLKVNGVTYAIADGIVYKLAANIEMRNSISLNPNNYHIFFLTGGVPTASVSSEYNLFWPDTGTKFTYNDGIGYRYYNFAGWQVKGWDNTGSAVADPLFIDVSSGDFHLQSNSPAIDAGIDVGLTQDYEGNTIPQDGDNNGSSEPDIGAYEYVSGPPDPTAPSTPENLTATPASESRIDLSWSASSDSESGVSYYRIYRAGSQIDTSVSTSYSNTGLNSGSTYSYEVSAVNGQGLESGSSNTAQATTLSDVTPPSIVSVTVSETSIEILFSESLDTISSEQTSNYSVNNGISVTAASLNTDTVTLTTSAHTEGLTYTLTVVDIQDLAGNPMGQTEIDYQYNQGLVGYWRFEGNANDETGINNGTLVDGADIVADTSPDDRGNVLSLDGAGDYVETPLYPDSNTRTMAMWVNFNAITGRHVFAGVHDESDHRLYFGVGGTDGSLYYFAVGDTYKGYDSGTSHSFSTGVWYHVALTANGSTARYYVNGAEVDSISYSYAVGSSSDWLPIGAFRNNGVIRDEYFNGLIDDARIYNRALTAGEILDLYNEGTAPDTNAPVLQTIGNKSVNENSVLTFDVNATDPDGDPITYSVQNQPSGADFSGQTFSWTPSYDQAGTYLVTFIAKDDNQAQDLETITITVNNVNRVPVLGPIADQSVNENALLSFSVSATDADGQTIAYSVSGLPTGAVFVSQTFTWTPSYDQAGNYPVTFTADDGQAQDSETITITVINVNRAPVLTAIGNRTAYADVLLTFTIDATDSDGDAITYSAGTLPSGATFTGQDFNWTPSQSQVGSYAVTFIASDSQLQDSETVTMTVDVDSLAPTVTNCSPAAGSIQVPLNNLITLNVTDVGIGVDAATVTIEVNNNIVYTSGASPDGNCQRLGTKADYKFVYQSTSGMFYYDQTVIITVNATDLAGNVMDEYSYSFATEMYSFGQNKQVNSGLANNDRPVTVCDSSGNIWAAWHAGAVGNRDIYISKLAAGEENFSGTVRLTDKTTDQCNPAIALDSNDKLYVVWQDNREGDWDIYISTSVDGISWSTEIRVNDPNDGNQVNPAIVIDSQNYAHIVWQDDSAGNQDIFIATSSDGFATPTVSQQITFDNFDQVEPAITADSANTIYVVWTDMRNGSNDIYGAASNNPWTNVAIVSNVNNQSSPAIATESTGSILHFLWVDDTPGNNDIYYASSDGLPGSPLTGSSIIDDSSGADQLDPTIAVTGSTGNDLKVFACWQDWRNTDADLYFAELSAGSGTNVFVGDSGSNADQGKPVIGIDEYSHPYLIWADNRSTDTDIYYAGSTFIEPVALASELVTASASSSTIVGTDPQAITTVDDVSIVVPAGACSYDVTITLAKIANLPAFAAPCLGGYDFGPSGIQFSQPVTITIPYVFSSSDGSVTPYWFNSLTGALSQQGITDIQDITISSSLHALSFKTTHFTAFFLFAGGGTTVAIVGGGGGGGGGCSVSASGEGNIVEYILPYIGLAVVMAILKMRDARDRKARNMTAGKC